MFFVLAILIGVHWYVIMVLMCISLANNNGGHLFMCLFAICIIFFGVVPVQTFCPFKNMELFSSSRVWIVGYIVRIQVSPLPAV